MPNYNVYMCQGITIADLRGNMLLTGAGNDADALQSCSAIVFVNTATWAAGLYHFPEGDIDSDADSQLRIGRLATRVMPNEVYIGYGTLGPVDDFGNARNGASVINGEKLTAFVRRLFPQTRVRRMPATGGVVTVTSNAGATVIGHHVPNPWVDLRNDAEGDHGAYRTYGHAR
jgi:hypothetical protein